MIKKIDPKRCAFRYLPHVLTAALLMVPCLNAFAQQKNKEATPVIAAAPAQAQADVQVQLAKPFVTVNGEAQSKARAELLLREQFSRGASDSADLRNAVRQNLIAQAVMAQEARKAGLQKNPLLQAQLELVQQNLLAQAWQEQLLIENPPTEVDIRAEYDRQLRSLGDIDFRLRHILIADEAAAKALIEKIKSGAKLADLAQEISQDTETRHRGGLSDWVNVARLMPPLVEVLKTLKDGQLAAQPIKTDAGWHVLQREESRPFQAMTYEQAEPQMRAILAARKLETRVKELISRAKIK